MRLGIAHHLGWAVAVVASPAHEVVDRRRIELVGDGLPPAPIHHVGGPWEEHRPAEPVDDEALRQLVAEVRASVVRTAGASLDELAASLPGPILSLSVRQWPTDLPTDLAALRRPPHESRADSAMYAELLADLGQARGWQVHTYDQRRVEAAASALLGTRAHDVLHGPRARLGPPWTKDHRSALAATVVAASVA